MSRKDQRFVAAASVTAITTENGGAVLLDLHTDRFLGIDPMGLLIWELLTTPQTQQEIVQCLAERYQVEAQDTVEEDVQRFLHHLEAHHLLLPEEDTSEPHDADRARTGWPLLPRFHAWIFLLVARLLSALILAEWLEAWLLLWWVHLWLTYGTLSDLARKLHTLPATSPVTYEHPEVRRLAARVQSAAAWLPFKAVCLHQNLALGFLLRRRAFHADLVIGVSTFPFFAHAWLQSAGEIIHWEPGLGPGVSVQRLSTLSLIFCSGSLSENTQRKGGM